MKILKDFRNNHLEFTDGDVIYLPNTEITNNALMEIDIENSNKEAIDLLKESLTKDYEVKRILDRYITVEKAKETDFCIRRKYEFTLLYEIYDELTDETIKYIINIKMELARNERLTVWIKYKNKKIFNTFLLSPKYNNDKILSNLIKNNHEGFSSLLNSLSTITSDSITILKKFDLIKDEEIYVLNNYLLITGYIKGGIDSIISLLG